jgi:hypothetical protein
MRSRRRNGAPFGRGDNAGRVAQPTQGNRVYTTRLFADFISSVFLKSMAGLRLKYTDATVSTSYIWASAKLLLYSAYALAPLVLFRIESDSYVLIAL